MIDQSLAVGCFRLNTCFSLYLGVPITRQVSLSGQRRKDTLDKGNIKQSNPAPTASPGALALSLTKVSISENLLPKIYYETVW